MGMPNRGMGMPMRGGRGGPQNRGGQQGGQGHHRGGGQHQHHGHGGPKPAPWGRNPNPWQQNQPQQQGWGGNMGGHHQMVVKMHGGKGPNKTPHGIAAINRGDGKMAEDSETIKDIPEVKTGAVSVNSNLSQTLPGIYLK